MPRPGRYFVPEQPQHIIQRGNNRGVVFFCDADYLRYLGWLREAASEHGCAIHAYVLMTNHVHLLVSPAKADSIPRMMQSLGRRYVGHVNASYGRTGTLWEGRYRATAIDSEAYFLACCRYIELNPVRASIVAHPRQYRWSSHRAQAEGARDTLVTHHPLYQALGSTGDERQRAYRELFETLLDEDFVTQLRKATNSGWPLGGERFKRDIAAAVKRRAAPLPKGRPHKEENDPRQIDLF